MAKTVLLAGESTATRRAVDLALPPPYYAVVEAGDFDEALAVFEEQKPCLVLANALSVACRGYELCRELKERGGAALLLLHPTEIEKDAERIAAAKPDGVLATPFKPWELSASLGELDRESRHRAGLAGVAHIASLSSPIAAGPDLDPDDMPDVEIEVSSDEVSVEGKGQPAVRPAGERLANKVRGLASGGALGVERRELPPPPPGMPVLRPSSKVRDGAGRVSQRGTVAAAGDGPRADAARARLDAAIIGVRALEGMDPAVVEALTRICTDVVQQAVWEIVPDLAEALIKAELRRVIPERSELRTGDGRKV